MTRILVLAVVVGVISVATATATIGPATWTVHRFLGTTDGGWVTLRTDRQLRNAYAYRSDLSLETYDLSTGCIRARAVLDVSAFEDADASETWSKATESAPGGAPVALPRDLHPAVPSGWVDALKVAGGAIVITRDDRDMVLVADEALKQWASLQGVGLSEEPKLVDVYESVHGWRDDAAVFVEVETGHRDIDVDFGRFVVPVDIGAALNAMDRDADIGKTQPTPLGC